MTDQELMEDLHKAICFYYPCYKNKTDSQHAHTPDLFVSDRPLTNLAVVLILMPLGLFVCVSASLFNTVRSIIYRA